MTNAAIIVGGGRGKRFQGDLPKQFIPVGGMSLLARTTEVFNRCPLIDIIVVVVPPDWVDHTASDLRAHGCDKVGHVTGGGDTRQLSCWHGLQMLKDDPPDIVVIHDAVRPLVSDEMVAVAVREGTAPMTFGVPAVDTMVVTSGSRIETVLPRDYIYHVQTPQSFPFTVLWDAHVAAQMRGITDAGDDATLVLHAGHSVRVVRGDSRNIKVTSHVDMELVRYFSVKG